MHYYQRFHHLLPPSSPRPLREIHQSIRLLHMYDRYNLAYVNLHSQRPLSPRSNDFPAPSTHFMNIFRQASSPSILVW
jgi:hypothetical protein